MIEHSDLVEAMRQHEVRVTAQRALILETLANMSGHPTAQEIYDQVTPQLPGLNLATVYRNLYTLHEAGLVDLMSVGPGVQRFAYRDPENLHAHLVCRNCQQVMQISPDELEALRKRLRDRYGFEADVRHVALTGLCTDCGQSS